MTPFTPATIELSGTVAVAAPVHEAFPLFSPEGEKLWIKEWAPEPIYPAGAIWEQGQIFRTQEERGPAVWVISALDRDAHTVEYFRVESTRYVARVRVRCAPDGAARTRAHVSYVFVGLTDTGNDDIAAMSQHAHGQRMQRWERMIQEYIDAR